MIRRSPTRALSLVCALALAPALGVSALCAGCQRVEEPTGAAPSRAEQPVRPAAPTPPPQRPRPPVQEQGHAAAQAEGAAAPAPGLLSPPAQDMTAPPRFLAVLETTEGEIRIDVHRDWAPRGADRFFTMIRLGYLRDVAFFRVVQGFMAQGGLHGDPRVNAVWRRRRIQDDPAGLHSNSRGMVSFAMAGPNSRTTQFFINLVDNARLDPMGFAPFGRVLNMDVVDRLYAGYGDGPPHGRGPQQARIQTQGNSFLEANFPELDYIRAARIESAPAN